MNKIKYILTTFVIIFLFIVIYFLSYNLAEPKAYDFMTKQFAVKSLPFDKIKKVNPNYVTYGFVNSDITIKSFQLFVNKQVELFFNIRKKVDLHLLHEST